MMGGPAPGVTMPRPMNLPALNSNRTVKRKISTIPMNRDITNLKSINELHELRELGMNYWNPFVDSIF
jgi:hypothetical protein